VAALAADAVVRTGLLLVAALVIVRAIPSLAANPLVRGIHDVPLLLLTAGALEARARSAADATERRFWRLLVGSWLYWILVRILEFAFGGPRGEASQLDLARDLVFLGFYVCLIFALELQPERGDDGGAHPSLRALRALSAATVAVALVAYLTLVPGALGRPRDAPGRPSYFLYALLDVYVAVRAYMRWRRVAGTRWREPYRWLTATAALWALADMWGGVAAAPQPPLVKILSNVVFLMDHVLILCAARAFSLPIVLKAPARLASREIEPLPARGLWGGPPFAFLVTLPIVQLALDTVGVLDPAQRELRETLVLLTIAVLAVLAVLYERVIGAESRRLTIETQERRQQAQRLEALGQLAAGIAHDFNNVMTIVLGSADFLSQGLPKESALVADVQQIKGAVRRGAEMVRRLLAFGRSDGVQEEHVNVGALVVELSRTLRRLLPETIVLEVETHHAPPARARPAAVEQILVNVVTNARDAMPKGGRLHVKVSETSLDAAVCRAQGWGAAGRFVVLAVSDDGVGMTDEVKQRLFDPFFTTKEMGRGTGLGMAMVADLVRLSRGHVDVVSAPDRGTSVTVLLPAAGERPPVAETRAEPDARTGAGRTLLIVEDDPQIRRLAERTLAKRGYRVLTAADGRDGLALFDSHAAEIALVISDVVMPNLTGPELYDAVRAKSTTRFIFTTGYSEGEAMFALDPSVPRLPKPWSVDDLVKKVQETLPPEP
jgi:signal transduction histidine kinase/CheY-like chemotaxis protein